MKTLLAGVAVAAVLATQPVPTAPGLIINMFAGGGGTAEGIREGMERDSDININHDGPAIAMHAVNHPRSRHYREDVWGVDPVEAVDGQDVDLLWLSPDCRHFSKAKGAKPVSKKIRGLANVAVKWAHAVKIRQGIILENVEEFETWGPLIETEKGMMPCPKRTGEYFRRWVAAIRRAGATSVQWRTLRACDYGAPTIRKRLFLIARFDGLPIVWPAPTHGAPNSEGVRSGRLLPFKTAADCIDWSIPCPSIFDRATPLADATNKRIAAGFVRYVLEAARPFIVPVTHAGGPKRVIDIDAPLPTVTAAHRGEFALITPKFERAEKVAAFMAQNNAGFYAGHGRSMAEPMSTVTAAGSQQSLVTANLVKLRGTCADGQPVTDPMPTLTAGGTHVGLVYAFLVKYYGNELDGHGLTAPLGTVTTKDRFGLVTVSIDGEDWVVTDIGFRMLIPRELARAQGFPDSYILDPVCEYTTETGRVKFGPLPKSHQIAKIGNSVCPVMAKVLTAANFGPKAGSLPPANDYRSGEQLPLFGGQHDSHGILSRTPSAERRQAFRHGVHQYQPSEASQVGLCGEAVDHG